jgi:transcription-repair coupling factor (superfamily II helicase)
LVDRFGPVPEQGRQLIDTIRLRWMAKAIGLEKLVLKTGKLVCYFVADPESGYYQGAVFMQVINYVKENPQKCTMRQKNDKLMLVFENTTTVRQAIARLEPISPLPKPQPAEPQANAE